MIDWEGFLSSWDREKDEILSLVPEERAGLAVIAAEKEARHYAPPASGVQIARAEARFGCVFPEDLRSFYSISNGWSLIGMGDLKLVSIENFKRITDVEASYWLDVNEYFCFENNKFISPKYRERTILISNESQIGFCVANQKDSGDWEFACVEFGARSDKFGNFTEFMGSARWYCLHYLRANLG